MAIAVWTTTQLRSSRGRWQAQPSTTATFWPSTKGQVNNLRWFIRTDMRQIDCRPKITQRLCRPWPDGINRENSLESNTPSSRPCQANSATTAALTFKQGRVTTNTRCKSTLAKASKPSSWAPSSTWRSRIAKPIIKGPRARPKTDSGLKIITPCMKVDLSSTVTMSHP